MSGEPVTVRVATFNIQELDAAKVGDVDGDGVGQDPQARAAATIIQRIRPDILVLNEVDHHYGEDGEGLDLVVRRYRERYLATGADPIDYPYLFVSPNNTGMLSGLDLDSNGVSATDAHRGTRVHGDDSWGYGEYPGQYSMAVLSRHPIDPQAARTFQTFLWKDLPGNHIPPGYFSDEVAERFRLSSKSHWDVPVAVEGRTLHVLVSHPTPPVFDGDEDRNGRRNYDEVKFWKLYLDDDPALYDDRGVRGGYGSDDPFVIAGDLNANPLQTESVYDGSTAIGQLLDHPRVRESGPVAVGSGALVNGPAGPPRYLERATATFGGGSRVDYVLPSRSLEIVGGGVFWPAADEDPEGARLAEVASDHRMVWVDVRLP